MGNVERITFKKTALWALIISTSFSALLGIITLVSGDFGDVELKILLTSLSISAGSICALSCAFLLEKRRIIQLAFPGIMLAIIGTILLITGIWTEFDNEIF